MADENLGLGGKASRNSSYSQQMPTAKRLFCECFSFYERCLLTCFSSNQSQSGSRVERPFKNTDALRS